MCVSIGVCSYVRNRTGVTDIRAGIRIRRRSIAPVALLLERVPVHVVPVALPEPGVVVVGEVETAGPLDRLPEVEVGHDEAKRPTVSRLEFLAAIPPCEEVAGAGGRAPREGGGGAGVW